MKPLTTPIEVGGALGRIHRSGRNDREAITAAAKEFEALLLGELLKSMRKTIPDDGLEERSYGREVYEGMYDEQVSILVARRGGIGLHRMIVDQLGAGLPDAERPGPLAHPLGPGEHRVSSSFGPRTHPIDGDPRLHGGVDLPASSGHDVVAARAGTVVQAGPRGGYGLMVELSHPGGVTTRYAHLRHVDVRPGDVVRSGDRLGAVGATGSATGPHLHFEVRRDGRPIDPEDLLATRSGGGTRS